MTFALENAARLAASVAVIALAVAGCGSDDTKSGGTSTSASPPSATSAAAGPSSAAPTAGATADLSPLLMDAAAIPSPGPAFVRDAPVPNPNNLMGVAALYHTADNAARIGDTVLVFTDPAAAADALNSAKAALGNSVTGAPAPSAIGTNGTLATGTSPDGSKGVAVLLFTEQNALVNLQFDSSAGDTTPAPTDFVEKVGQLQLDAVKNNLTKVGN